MPASPPHRVTPAQVLALVIIWSGVAYGLTAKDGPRQIAHTQTAQLIACR